MKIHVDYDEGENWEFVSITDGRKTWIAVF